MSLDRGKGNVYVQCAVPGLDAQLTAMIQGSGTDLHRRYCILHPTAHVESIPLQMRRDGDCTTTTQEATANNDIAQSVNGSDSLWLT